MAIMSWKSTLKKVLEGITGRERRESPAARSFSEQQEKQGAYDSRVRGLRNIAVDRIVGSVGRYQDFDSRFRKRDHLPSERLEKIKGAMREGRPLPPVKLYQIKDEFYVVDGNHRIAAAKELGHDEILAHIIEFIPSGNTLDDVLYQERAHFSDRTQLPADIQLTELGQYRRLLDQVNRHQDFLARDAEMPPSFEEAALDWYRTIFRPLCQIIRRARLTEFFPSRTVADLYVYIAEHQWNLNRNRRYGKGIDELITSSMEDFRTKMADREINTYPEMQRGITAFILMNVQARHELKLIDRIFKLAEVQEVHAVHGDVDILVKIHLNRDLLSSDAEIISNFVHSKIRKLQGVNSTKTLIPGLSKIKSPD